MGVPLQVGNRPISCGLQGQVHRLETGAPGTGIPDMGTPLWAIHGMESTSDLIALAGRQLRHPHNRMLRQMQTSPGDGCALMNADFEPGRIVHGSDSGRISEIDPKNVHTRTKRCSLQPNPAVHSAAASIPLLLPKSFNCRADHHLGDNTFLHNELRLQLRRGFRLLQLPDLGSKTELLWL
jgi:hypothetical protein